MSSSINSTSSQKIVCTEGESRKEGTQTSITDTTMVSEVTRNIALRTIPVYLKNGSRRLKVNALLDDASTKTYLNADVAAELGLKGHPQKVSVSVLNGQVESFAD